METFPDQRQPDPSDSETVRPDAGQEDVTEEQGPLAPEHHVLAAAWALTDSTEPYLTDDGIRHLLDQLIDRPVGPGPAADALDLLAGLRQVAKLVEELAESAAGAYGVANPDGTYVELGRAWGVTRQTARLRWPGAILPRPQQSRTATLRGGTAQIEHDPLTNTWTWTATGGDGSTGRGEEPYIDPDEAQLDAMMFLREHSGVRPAPAQN